MASTNSSQGPLAEFKPQVPAPCSDGLGHSAPALRLFFLACRTLTAASSSRTAPNGTAKP